MITSEQISRITKANLENVKANWPLVVEALEWAGINSRLVQIGMAATIAAETGNFQPIKERRSTNPGSAVYKAQERYWASGYYGRGYIQLTWQKNYHAAANEIGVDLIGNPDLALQPDIAAKIAAWFFRNNFIHRLCERKDWTGVRRVVNGPNYASHEASLQRFLNYCKLLEAGV